MKQSLVAVILLAVGFLLPGSILAVDDMKLKNATFAVQ
jgi:hypothetical protein